MHVGFGNYVPHWKVAAILVPGRSASKRLRDRAAVEGRLHDARFGRRTRSLVLTDANQVVLSAVAPETLMERLEKARLRTTGGTPVPPTPVPLISCITLEELEREGA